MQVLHYTLNFWSYELRILGQKRILQYKPRFCFETFFLVHLIRTIIRYMCEHIGIQNTKQSIRIGTSYTVNIVGTPEPKLKIGIEEDKLSYRWSGRAMAPCINRFRYNWSWQHGATYTSQKSCKQISDKYEQTQHINLSEQCGIDLLLVSNFSRAIISLQ